MVDEKIWELIFGNFQKILSPEIRLIEDLSLSISKTELIALLMIWKNNEITMTQLADHINLPMSTMTGIINRLVHKGYVERLTCESNRRIVVVSLTQKGEAVAESIKQTVVKYWWLFTESLTDQEKELLYQVLSKASTVFGKDELDDKGVNKR